MYVPSAVAAAAAGRRDATVTSDHNGLALIADALMLAVDPHQV